MGNQRSCVVAPSPKSQYGGPGLANEDGCSCYSSVDRYNEKAVLADGFSSNSGNLLRTSKAENSWKRKSDNTVIQGLYKPFGNKNDTERFFGNPLDTLSKPEERLRKRNEVNIEKENLTPEFKSLMTVKSSHLRDGTTKFENSKPNTTHSASLQQKSSDNSLRDSTKLGISLETPRSSIVDKLSFSSEEILNPASDSTSLSSLPASESAIGDGVSGGSSDGGGLHAHDIPLRNVRNFSIIAHVDHGKSTLADRLLELTGAIDIRTPTDNKQVLDRLQVEKERGITVKAQTASLFYKHKDEDYLLNLIDTPGHVDFSNEVSRSLAACQGVILLVDANQGVQAQTVANFHLAANQKLAVIPVLNKIDLPNAMPDQVKEQLFNLFTIDPEDVLMISAKTGAGVDALLEALVDRVPAPPGDRGAPFRALIFDSWFDRFRGAMTLVYVRDGLIRVGDEVTSAHSRQSYGVRALGLLRPNEQPANKLVGGQVGFMVCNMRSAAEAHIGDTLVEKGSTAEPLTGFKPARPMVFSGLFPMDQSEHTVLRSALEKLALNDPAVTVTTDSSPVLGHGWRVGFLGLLHMEVFNQRLEQEFGAEALMTAPSVPYKVKLAGKKVSQESDYEVISDPSKMPDNPSIVEILEPIVLGTIICPHEYSFKIVAECVARRGTQTETVVLDSVRAMLRFTLPLNEIIVDFHDALKAMTSGYASFDYEDYGYAPADIVKLDILMNGDIVDALSSMVHRSKAEAIGRKMCAKLVEIVPRQMIQVAIQAAVGNKVLARETLKAFRKDVTAKLYGGDVTRKQKLLRKQTEGKKRMKKIANINIPKEVFIDFLKN